MINTTSSPCPICGNTFVSVFRNDYHGTCNGAGTGTYHSTMVYLFDSKTWSVL